MKKAGIIGGLGPLSTAEYYRGIVEGCTPHLQSMHTPRLVVESLDFGACLQQIEAGDWDAVTEELVAATERLAAAGAEVGAIASNTPHAVFDRLAARSPIPLVSIVEACCTEAAVRGFGSVGVMGTAATMRCGLYAEALVRHGVRPVLPSPAEQEAVQSILFPRLEQGLATAADRRRLAAVACRLADAGAEAILLGCTELRLGLRPEQVPVPLLDSAAIHIDAVVRAMLEED